jgi:hypothetical protein
MVASLKNRRGIVWLLVLLAVLATGVGAVPLFMSGLPDPAVANREELLRWIVARDLAKESPETCLVLVNRLEAEFGTGVDWESLDGRLSEAQREQLWRNIPLLFRPWLVEKATAYARLAKAQRSEFMDGVFKTLAAWKGADRLRAKQAGGATAPSLLRVFFDLVESYKQSAGPSQREQITQFVAALQFRALTSL